MSPQAKQAIQKGATLTGLKIVTSNILHYATIPADSMPGIFNTLKHYTLHCQQQISQHALNF
jgi:hypothetical protein